MLNLSHLQFVQSVAELASFSRAAERSHVTQSSLSNAVAQVEELLGGRIFSRTTRRVGVTAFGERVLPLVANVLSAAEELRQGAQGALQPAHKMIRIGVTPLLDTRIVAATLEPFRRRQPEVELVFKECFVNDLQSRLLEGTIDLAFRTCGAADKRLMRAAFYAEELFYLPGNRKAVAREGAGPVRLEEIGGETLALTVGCGLADATRKIFRQHRRKFREYPGQALSYRVLEDWAGLGVASAILPKSKVSAANRTARQLRDGKGPVEIRYEMTWKRSANKPQQLQEFLEYFQGTAKRIVRGLAENGAAS